MRSVNPMKKLGGSASRLMVDVEGGIRKISREVGRGVTEALQERPQGEEPGWRAERLAQGALRGIDVALEDEHLRASLSAVVAEAVESALQAALVRAPAIERASEDAARALARGALAEVRAQLGAQGDGPLARSLSASTRRLAREGARAMATPLAVLAVAMGLGALGLLVLRRA